MTWPAIGARFETVSSPAEIPHADEALKALVVRFKEAPGSSACTELASALLARGHASEALRVAEHGLQLVPDQVDGRVERAAALLALGRPRVAYVELRRALAIDPTHRRGMRLLGKTYRDAGAPGRAAALLAKRSMDPDYEAPPPPKPAKKKAEWRQRPAIDADTTAPLPSNAGAIPELFSALTKDLGLGAAVPETTAPRRVEVTQIIRRKGLMRPPRSASELAEIDGPIVDTTQPGHILESDLDELAQEVTTREPAPLFSAASSAGLNAFALDDEPLFQEDMPFAVRPVDASTDIEPVFDDDPVDAPTDQVHLPLGDKAETKPGDTLVDHLEEGTDAVESLAPAPTSPLVPEGEPNVRRFVAGKEKSRSADDARATGDAPRFDGSVPVVEKSRAHLQQRLEIVEPKVKSTHVVIAVVCAIAMLVYFVGLGVYLEDGIRPWFDGGAAKGRTEAPAAVDEAPAHSARAEP